VQQTKQTNTGTKTMRNSITTGSNRVSDQQRRDHSRAIRAREQWRERYAVLSDSIRNAKRLLSTAHRNNSVDRSGEIELRALRHYADLMMLKREVIKEDLCITAYEYVDAIAA